MKIRALFFDVFGTCVDWRSTIVDEGRELNRRKGLSVDWAAFADDWRRMYQPSMERVRNGSRPWTILDSLHRESLDSLVETYGLSSLSDSELGQLNKVWHRLEPWPDTVPGLIALKKLSIIAPLSNGNVALLVNMSKRAEMPWDVILGAEVARHYKPQPEAYRVAASLLGLEPEQCMMVAAHNSDLEAASRCGLHTAFIARPTEHGTNQDTDLIASGRWDIIAQSFIELADRLDDYNPSN